MSNTPFVVRPLTGADVEGLTGRDAGRAGQLREQLALASDAYTVLGAFAGDDLAGWVVLDSRADGELLPELKNLWVYPKYRRQGLGMQLTGAVEKIAAQQGFDEVNLAVDPENPAAIPMYVGLDYSATGHHRGGHEDGQPRQAVFRKSLTMGRR